MTAAGHSADGSTADRRLRNGWWRLLLYSLALAPTLWLFDYLIETQPLLPRWQWAVADVLFHMLVALLLLLPARFVGKWPISTAIAAAVVAGLIDFDHFIAAGALSVQAAISLPARPWSHSLLFAALLALLLYLASRKSWVVLVVLVALVSHVLRDAAGSPTPLFFPLAPVRIPWVAYVALCLVAVPFVASISIRLTSPDGRWWLAIPAEALIRILCMLRRRPTAPAVAQSSPSTAADVKSIYTCHRSRGRVSALYAGRTICMAWEDLEAIANETFLGRGTEKLDELQALMVGEHSSDAIMGGVETVDRLLASLDPVVREELEHHLHLAHLTPWHLQNSLAVIERLHIMNCVCTQPAWEQIGYILRAHLARKVILGKVIPIVEGLAHGLAISRESRRKNNTLTAAHLSSVALAYGENAMEIAAAALHCEAALHRKGLSETEIGKTFRTVSEHALAATYTGVDTLAAAFAQGVSALKCSPFAHFSESARVRSLLEQAAEGTLASAHLPAAPSQIRIIVFDYMLGPLCGLPLVGFLAKHVPFRLLGSLLAIIPRLASSQPLGAGKPSMQSLRASLRSVRVLQNGQRANLVVDQAIVHGRSKRIAHGGLESFLLRSTDQMLDATIWQFAIRRLALHLLRVDAEVVRDVDIFICRWAALEGLQRSAAKEITEHVDSACSEIGSRLQAWNRSEALNEGSLPPEEAQELGKLCQLLGSEIRSHRYRDGLTAFLDSYYTHGL